MARRQTGLCKRCIVLVLGLFLLALGISLSIKANLGTSPISCVPYIYSLGFYPTMGELTILLNVLFVFLQICLLGKKFPLIQLSQIPLAFIFGFFTDFTITLVSSKDFITNYFTQQIILLLSIALIAFGVFLETKANVIYLAGDGVVVAISNIFHKDLGKTKIYFDCCLVAIGIASSFFLIHDLQGIREGTLLSAILVGALIKFFTKNIKYVDALIHS